ncbi:MAG: oxygen-dependent coproporphyrinogen oxidase [Planctomycetota bacterium]
MKLFQDIQDAICRGVESIETQATFQEDLWERDGGGGGRTRVIGDGNFLEKGGVNYSEVHGEFTEEFAQQVPGSGREFYASGISLVLHPVNPHVPTVHANFRHIRHGDKSWFGGGADLTPYYFHAEDKQHFHDTWRTVCEEHPGVGDYPAWRDWCDRYFYLPHRGERRGVGGIFFDYVWVDDDNRASVESFVEAAGHRFLESYLPIVQRRIETPWTEAQKEWQELRRGRYVEFNLIYDRGTIFGLKTGGRTESILMSLPKHARWAYDHTPAPGTPEAALLDELKQPPPPE